jgi:type I restriction enzyme S subunit
MNADWRPIRLDELGEVARGKSRHRPRNDPRLFGGPYPYIQTADIMAADPYIVSHNQTLSEFGFIQSRLWPAETLCITIAGANTARTAILKFRACFPDSIIGFRPDHTKADIHFVKYSLDLMKDRFLAITRGATQDNLSLDKLLSFPISTPPLETQRRIARILSAYDDLIDVNSRRIAILEEMARRIFEEWFVKFRFPGADHQTCEGLGTFVPQGWIVTTLAHVLSGLESGSRPKGGVGSDGDIPSIGAENVIGLGKYDYTREKMIASEYFASMKRGHVRDRDVMLYKDGAYIGRLSMAWKGFPHSTCVVNEHVFLLRTNEQVPAQFLFFWLDQPELQAKIRGLNANAAQPGLNQPGIRGLPIILPPASLLHQFDQITKPVLDLLFNLALQNPGLREARDLLLPKLMSGQSALSEAERQIERPSDQAAAE